MTSEAAQIRARSRIPWIDTARALCVLAVVLMHTTISLLVVADPSPLDLTWRQIVDAMTPLRMPALSLLSGMLLARRIRAGWTDGSARASMATSAWLYVVWLAVFLVLAITVGWSMWLGPFGAGTPLQGIQAFVDQLVLPRSVLWYVFALVVWSAVLATVRHAAPGAVLLTLAALSIASFYMDGDGSDQYRNVIRYFVFFAVGVYFSTPIRARFVERPLATGAIAVCAFAAVTFVSWFGLNDNVGYVLSVPRDIAGALVVITIAVGLCTVPILGRGLAWVGRRTLPIYVMHVPLLELLTMFPSWWIDVLDGAFARAVAPVVITCLVAAVAVLFHSIATRTPACVLFMLPSAWRLKLLEARA